MKHPMLKGSTLAAAVFLASQATAGGFDNSGRGFDIIYGDNNVVSTSYGMSFVPMKAKVQQEANNSQGIVSSGEILDDFQRPQVGVRYNATEDMTCAAQYEVPFAAGVAYADDSLAYVNSQAEAKSAPITTKYESESFTFACGYTFGLPTGELMVFGGPRVQDVSGSFDEDLQPDGSPLTGKNDNLTVKLDGGTEIGYMAGVAFSIPEIALRASILYHSQVDYTATGTLTAIVPVNDSDLGAPQGAMGLVAGTPFQTSATAETFTPQAVEIALQSGIAENTLAFLKMRWSEYGKLKTLKVQGGNDELANTNDQLLPGTGGASTISLQELAANGADELVNPEVSMFSNDTLDYSFGLGRRINDKLSLGASFAGSIKLGGKSDDTPIGADATSLRLPGETAHTVSFGGEYSVLPNLKLNGGIGFTFIDEYRVETTSGSYRAEFDKTEATSFQMGVTYEI